MPIHLFNKCKSFLFISESKVKIGESSDRGDVSVRKKVLRMVFD